MASMLAAIARIQDAISAGREDFTQKPVIYKVEVRCVCRLSVFLVQLSKAGLYVICMEDDILVWVCDAQVPYSCEELFERVPKKTVQLKPQLCGGHHVHWMCCGVKNMSTANRAIQFGNGWLPCARCNIAFALVVSAVNSVGAPNVMTS
eukprot:scaffold4129_cov82-Cyclotella_meneghiniana.AAC.2